MPKIQKARFNGDATSTPVGTGFFADNNGQELKNFVTTSSKKYRYGNVCNVYRTALCHNK